LAGWPMGTYVMYVIHLAIAVPMLVIEVPFGKWSHLFYRPLAIFLTTAKEKALKPSKVDVEAVRAKVGDAFLGCMQCGTCTSLCPWNEIDAFSPRRILRQIGLGSGTEQELDQAIWACVTCNACGIHCPRGIDIVDITRSVRRRNVESDRIPQRFELALHSLKHNGNPWSGLPEKRMQWAEGLEIPVYAAQHEYCLFTCCTTAYDANFSSRSRDAARALPKLLAHSGTTFGTLGTEESCCGDPAHNLGDEKARTDLRDHNTRRFQQNEVKKIVTTSPHCLNSFKNHYPGLNGTLRIEHYTQLLDRLVTRGALSPELRYEGRVTFHDPCYLGRHNGIYDAPRRVLAAIPGLELVEMSDSRDASLCCGGGGGGAWDARSADKSFAALRIKQALAAGAEIIATACPYCTRMLNDAVTALGVQNQVAVRDIAVLLLNSIAATPEKDASERTALEVSHV